MGLILFIFNSPFKSFLTLSPKALNPSTLIKKASDGKNTIQGADRKCILAAPSILAHSGSYETFMVFMFPFELSSMNLTFPTNTANKPSCNNKVSALAISIKNIAISSGYK